MQDSAGSSVGWLEVKDALLSAVCGLGCEAPSIAFKVRVILHTCRMRLVVDLGHVALSTLVVLVTQCHYRCHELPGLRHPSSQALGLHHKAWHVRCAGTPYLVEPY